MSDIPEGMYVDVGVGWIDIVCGKCGRRCGRVFVFDRGTGEGFGWNTAGWPCRAHGELEVHRSDFMKRVRAVRRGKRGARVSAYPIG